jgi:hypothetical protein
MQFTIEDLTATDGARVGEAARLLHTSFAPLGVWTTMAEAQQEVLESISAMTSPARHRLAELTYTRRSPRHSAKCAAGDDIRCRSIVGLASMSSV